MNNSHLLQEKILNYEYGFSTPFHLYNAAKGNKALVQKLKLQAKLPVHDGCVNTICWNDNGDYLLSGSDDKHICVTHGYRHSVLTSVQTGHRTNIFSARFLPNTSDKQVVSCSGDGSVIYTDLGHPETSLNNIFKCHFGTAYEVLTVPGDPHTFLSCGEDGTVRWFDLRIKNSCSLEDCKEDILVSCRCAATALAISYFTPYYLGVGCADGSVRIFDRRLLGTKATGNFTGSGIQALVSRFTVAELEGRSHRITSLTYSPNGEEMLVSYSSDYIYLYDVKDDSGRGTKILTVKRESKPAPKTSRAKSSHPVVRRLRVRGDWSDTGPSARPESESRSTGEQQSLHASLMQRMSDVLTRIFTGSSSQSQSPSASASLTSSPASSQPISTAADEGIREPGPSFSQTVDDQGIASKDLLNEACNQTSTTDEVPSNNSNLSETLICIDDSASMSDKPSTSSLGFDTVHQDRSENLELSDDLGKVILNESVKNLQDELSSRRKDFLNKHNSEPVINLHFNGQGVNSGLITMGMTNDIDRDHLDLPPTSDQPQVQTDSCNQPISEGVGKEFLFPSTSKSISSPKGLMEFSNSKEGHTSSDCDISPEPSTSCEKKESQRTDSPPIKSNETLKNEIVSHGTKLECKSKSKSENYIYCEEGESSTHRTDAGELPAEEIDDAEASTVEMDTDEEISRNDDEDTWNSEEQDSDKIELRNVPQPRVKCRYIGHRNARTMIKESTFWGSNFIMSGSDCGHIFIWDRHTTELVMILEADRHVVNCLQPHPFDPILASSGIDYDIKIWAPLQDEPFFDEAKAQEIVQRNEVMLEETRDTITVPASFMIRMLASLNQLRSAGGIAGWRRVVREAQAESRDNNN